MRACCDILGGGAGGVAATIALVMGLLGAELEFELVLLDVLELGLVVTVELESFEDVWSVMGGGGTALEDIVYCRL